MARPNILNTNISHENKTSVHTDMQSYHAQMKQRIETLRNNNQTLHIGEKIEKSDDECYREIADVCNNFLRTRDEKDELQLADTLEKYNMQLYCYPYAEISQDKRDVARMAFNGCVDRPQEFKLSNLLRTMKNRPWERAQTKPEDYDLAFSSAWQVFKQVPEFASVEDKVKKGLAQYGIPSEKLAELSVKDFCFIINEQFRNSGDMKAKVFPESYKARNTKRFINENEQEFRAGLMAMDGVRKDYVDALVAAMKRGLTDLTRLPGYKKEWDNQPVVDVHHIVNIKDATSLEEKGKSFADVNRYENMCFIVRHPSHDAMHALETDLAKVGYDGKPISREDIFYNRQIDRSTIYRIQPPDGVRCMFGLNSVIYDKKYLGLEENIQTNLPDAVKKENTAQNAGSGNDKAKEESIHRSHGNKYHARNRKYWDPKYERREGNRIGREALYDRINQNH